MLIEEKIVLGNQMVWMINTDGSKNAAAYLREKGFAVTQVESSGTSGRRKLSFLVTLRKKTQQVLDLVFEYSPEVFVAVEDVRTPASESRVFGEPRSRMPVWRRRVKF